MAEFGVQKPWEQPPKTNASKSRSRTKRQRKQKALRIEAGTNLPLVWALPDGVSPPQLDEDVAAVIRARLGFVPTNLLRVHTIEQRPAVLELYPLRRQPVEERAPRRRGASGPIQPWPTTFWFVDESLSARIAALEARGSADAALEARHRSPLYRHVPVEPELHEAGLQVGVRHVQQHLYAAHGKAASQRADDAALPARQSRTVEAPLFWPPELHNT